MPKRSRSIIVAAALMTGLLVAPPSGQATLPERAAASGRWNGVWEVHGQTQKNGSFVLFGNITFELLTGDQADAIRENFSGTCADTDDVYLMSWEFGGGGAGEACEIASLGSHLFGEYVGNDGGFGEFDNTYEGGPDWIWRGDYTPPSFNGTPSDIELKWRGKPTGQCPASTGVRAAGCAVDPVKEVRFTFTQGGLPKPPRPNRLNDVRTVGKGSVTYFIDEEDEDAEVFDVAEFGGNIVRELDEVQDNGHIKTRRMKFNVDEADLRFRFIAKEEDTIPGEVNDVRVFLDLEAVDSNDSRCPEKANNGQPRKATLYMREVVEGSASDVVILTVEGCPHHNYVFKGKKRVKVAIVHRTPS